MNRERWPAEIVHSANHRVAAKTRAFCAHLSGVRFAPQVVHDLVGIEGKANPAGSHIYRTGKIVKMYQIGCGRRIPAWLAVAIDTFAESKISRFLLGSSTQTKISGRLRAPKMRSKCLVHRGLDYYRG